MPTINSPNRGVPKEDWRVGVSASLRTAAFGARTKLVESTALVPINPTSQTALSISKDSAVVPYSSPSCTALVKLYPSVPPQWIKQRLWFSHLVKYYQHNPPKTLAYESLDGTKSARHYQVDGINFAFSQDLYHYFPTTLGRDVGVKCCIADQMRLGKTPQSLLILRNLLNRKSMNKTLIVVKSGNLWQWVEEHRTWVSALPNGIWPITAGKSWIPPSFNSYIISMDTLRLRENDLIEMGFDTIIVDEAHSFKNLESSRTIALNRIIKEGKIQNTIFLTGTPVLNRANEYYTILNHVAPTKFPSEASYKRNWLEQDDKGKYTRIKPWKIAQFRDEIAPHVLRREKQDVYTDLPALNIMFTFVKIEEDRLKKLYNAELDKMNLKRDVGGKLSFRDLQENLMALRRVIGMAKVTQTLAYIEEFIEESDLEKIAIGIHHKDVRDTLKLKVPKAYGVLTLSGEDSASTKYDIMNRRMRLPENRVLIINTLAGGVGMDFHYINNFLVIERQWSHAIEEQFNFRFYNPDKSIKSVPTFGEYLVVKGTLDEYFHNMVMEKKEVFKETVGTDWNIETDDDAFSRMIEETLDNRVV